MAGDILSEERLTLLEAARLLKVHVATIYRWHQRGVKGHKLSTVVIGALRYTSRERLEAFIEATTAAADGVEPVQRTSKQREKAIASAERELAEIL